MAAPSNSKNDASGPDSDSIELDTLDDLEASHLGDLRTTQYGCHENGGHEEEWSAALLGDGNRQDGARPVKERGYYSSCWRQASDIVVESAPTLLFTTVGLLLTGELLDHVARWRAMTAINELIMIIPVILNLKGNLEMNLSARLGTAANMGNLDDRDARRKITLGNLALLQVQSTVVASVAACVSMVLGSIIPDPISGTPQSPDGVVSNSTILSIRTPRPFPIKSGQPPSGLAEFTMVASSAMLSACLSSIFLGSFMCILVVVCRRLGLDPDNIAPPVASCLGDMVTLYLFGTVSSILIDFVNTPITFILVICLILSATFCTLVVRRNSEVKDLVWQGWSPLFGAMIITSGSGIILDIFASKYNGYALLTVVMNGLPGSVGSIFVSRLSTSLHAAERSLRVQKNGPPTRIIMLTLLLITLPVEVTLLSILHAFGWLRMPIIFAVVSVLFFCCAVVTSLVIANALTNFLWSRGLDPDMYALPIHSATMDLIGQLLLALCFYFVSLIGMVP